MIARKTVEPNQEYIKVLTSAAFGVNKDKHINSESMRISASETSYNFGRLNCPYSRLVVGECGLTMKTCHSKSCCAAEPTAPGVMQRSGLDRAQFNSADMCECLGNTSLLCTTSIVMET